MKTCSRCKKELSKDNFYPRRNRKKGEALASQCKNCRSEISKDYHRNLKIEMLEAYGGLLCNCCGENELTFLSLDHVFNDGASDRKRISGYARSSSTIYSYLKKNNWPNKEKYQVLCANCQWGKAYNGGICPHKAKGEGYANYSNNA